MTHHVGNTWLANVYVQKSSFKKVNFTFKFYFKIKICITKQWILNIMVAMSSLYTC